MEHMDITVPRTAVFIVYMIICVTNKLVVVTGYTNSDCKKGKTTDHKHVHFVINCFNCFCFKIQMHLLIFDNILKLVQLITTSDVTSGLFYIECSLGHFGLDCRNRCSSHCTNGEPCNHISGSCPNGCQDGFVGTKCNNCKKYLFIQLN